VVRDFWSNPALSYEQPSYEDQKKAVNILTEHKDKSYSFADAVSFVVMARLGLSEVVTFDRHFAQFGEFTVIDGSSI
jgi:predicted nucleic acid-binding protein